MQAFTIQKARAFSGRLRVPGDKSISHRALIFGALARGQTEVRGLLDSGDVRSTRASLERLGVEIRQEGEITRITNASRAAPMELFRAPTEALDCGNSGTTMRVLMGMLCGQKFTSELIGDASLSRRPMKRVAEPLRAMGARIELTHGELAPLKIHGGKLHGASLELKVASAQVKTALILAALQAEGETILGGALESRDHTERMLPYFGASLVVENGRLRIPGGQRLQGASVQVPGDPSSAAFWAGAAGLIPQGDILLEGVSLNPTRTGFFQVLKRMGAQVEEAITVAQPEPLGRIRVRAPAGLRGVRVERAEVPTLIDELPLLAVVATQAQGVTEVHGAEELRVKESDRIEMVARNLRAMGARIETFSDGFAVEGPQRLQGVPLHSGDDHRIAMAFAIAGLVAEGVTEIRGAECVGISYPGFFQVLPALAMGGVVR